jgi:high-affinity iron transporter
MILVQAATTVLMLLGIDRADSAVVARRVAASVQLAAQEYRIGVVQGRVVAPAEVEEAKLFLSQALWTARLLPPKAAAATSSEIERIQRLMVGVGTPDSVDVLARVALDVLATTTGVVLLVTPDRAPSLARGAELYHTVCRDCHGDTGKGDGPKALGLNPSPRNLTDAQLLAHATPLSFYQRITIGVAGTAMPSWETHFSTADRWALAAYATTLRQARPAGVVPPAFRDYALTATLEDQQVLDSLGASASAATLAAVRAFQEPFDNTAYNSRVFDSVRTMIRTATSLGAAGHHDDAAATAFDAYLEFEKVERSVRTRRPELANTLEAAFATLRTRLAGGGMPAEISAVDRDLTTALEEAERLVGDRMSAPNLFLQSLVIMLREGLEAILIIGALMAFLVKTGAGHRKRDIHVGVGAAVALSLLTAVLLETVFVISTAHQELIEATTLVVAVGVLFYVSYWLLSKMESTRWADFVKERVEVAVTGGSALALASTAFLAVYREGFETVLFYQALFLSGGAIASTVMPVVSGMVIGGGVLAVVYLAINRYGVRLPLTPFFGITSAFLYYTAFVFAGKAVAEFQEGGILGLTPLGGAWPRLPAFGIYPTLETMLAQGLLLLLAVVALVWIFVVNRLPHRTAAPVAAAVTASPPIPKATFADVPSVEVSVLRSLERMDADLAAIRAEVERLRDTVSDVSLEHGTKK